MGRRTKSQPAEGSKTIECSFKVQLGIGCAPPQIPAHASPTFVVAALHSLCDHGLHLAEQICGTIRGCTEYARDFGRREIGPVISINDNHYGKKDLFSSDAPVSDLIQVADTENDWLHHRAYHEISVRCQIVQGLSSSRSSSEHHPRNPGCKQTASKQSSGLPR